MPDDMLIKNLRPMGRDCVDVLVADGRFVAFGPNLAPPDPACPVVDGLNMLMLPGLVESHVHLDKTLWGLPWRPNSAGAAIEDHIENERRVRRGIGVPIGQRAGNLLRQCLANGSTHLRSHVDVDPEIGLGGVTALLALREEFRGRADLQLVAFPQTGMLIQPGTAALMEEAVKLGVDAVGGIDPAGIEGDPMGHLRTVFAIAGRHGSAVDIHLHDGGELGAWQIERIADFTQGSGMAGKVMIDHAYCLGMIGRTRLEAIARRLADQRISLMTSAPSDTAVPPVALLSEIGVNVCCGSDGIRDSWSPYGNGDMLERAMFLAMRFDWSKDGEFEAALMTATYNGARALGLTNYGIEPGKDADFVLVASETVAEAVVSRPRRELVVKRGRVIARAGVLVASYPSPAIG